VPLAEVFGATGHAPGSIAVKLGYFDLGRSRQARVFLLSMPGLPGEEIATMRVNTIWRRYRLFIAFSLTIFAAPALVFSYFGVYIRASLFMLFVASLAMMFGTLVLMLSLLIAHSRAPAESHIVTATVRRGGERGLGAALKVFGLLELFLPTRIGREDLGDALEIVAQWVGENRPSWRVYGKIVTASMWAVMNSLPELASALGRKSSNR